MPTPPVTLVVLAGGLGSRMGLPKSHLVLNGLPILSRLLHTLNWPGPTLLVTARSNARPPGAEAFDREVHDAEEAHGPLAGVSAALEHATTDRVVIVPVDMPNVSLDLLSELIDAHSSGGRSTGLMCQRTVDDEIQIEPFPCVLPVSLRPSVTDALRDGRRSLVGLVKAGACELFQADHWPVETWMNLNSPADVEEFHLRQAT